jgi:hypothetical protein
MTRPEEGTYDVEHSKIEAITFTSVPEDGGVELYVRLRDGRVFSFTSYTPAQVERLMRKNNWLSFVDLDALIVREGSLEAIMHALDQALLLGMEHLGIQVATPVPAEEEE